MQINENETNSKAVSHIKDKSLFFPPQSKHSTDVNFPKLINTSFHEDQNSKRTANNSSISYERDIKHLKKNQTGFNKLEKIYMAKNKDELPKIKSYSPNIPKKFQSKSKEPTKRVEYATYNISSQELKSEIKGISYRLGNISKK